MFSSCQKYDSFIMISNDSNHELEIRLRHCKNDVRNLKIFPGEVIKYSNYDSSGKCDKSTYIPIEVASGTSLTRINCTKDENTNLLIRVVSRKNIIGDEISSLNLELARQNPATTIDKDYVILAKCYTVQEREELKIIENEALKLSDMKKIAEREMLINTNENYSVDSYTSKNGIFIFSLKSGRKTAKVSISSLNGFLMIIAD